MQITIYKCDLCQEEYRSDVPNNYREVGNIKLDMKGCYYIQTMWEKSVCSKCAYKIRDSINKIMSELLKETHG